MKPVLLFAAVFSVFCVSATSAFADRLTLECRPQRSPLNPYGTGGTTIILDFDLRKAYFSGSENHEQDITEVTGTHINMGEQYWIDRRTGEYFGFLSISDCRVVPNKGF